MVLIGVIHQSGIEAHALVNAIHQEGMCHGHAVVELAMYHHHRGFEVVCKLRGVLTIEPLVVFPGGASVLEAAVARVVAGKLQVQVVHPGVVYQGGEAVGMSCDPAHHVPAVTSAGGGHAVFIHQTALDHVIGGLHNVNKGLVGVLTVNADGKVVPEAGGAVEVGHYRDISRRGEELAVPAVVPEIAKCVVGPAVYHHHQGILFRWVVVGRVVDEHLHIGIVSALIGHVFNAAKVDTGKDLIVKAGHLGQPSPAAKVKLIDLGGAAEVVVAEDKGLRAGQFCAAVGALVEEPCVLPSRCRDAEDGLHGLVFGKEIHRAPVGRPKPVLAAQVDMLGQRAVAPGLGVVKRHHHAVGIEVGYGLLSVKNKAAIRAEHGAAVVGFVFGGDVGHLPAAIGSQQKDVVIGIVVRRLGHIHTQGNAAAIGGNVVAHPAHHAKVVHGVGHQVGYLARAQLQAEQTRVKAICKPAVPEAVHGVFGHLGRDLAVAHFSLHLAQLIPVAIIFGKYVGGKGNAVAIGEPL